MFFFFFYQAEDGIRDKLVTGVQTCALPIFLAGSRSCEMSTRLENDHLRGGCAPSVLTDERATPTRFVLFTDNALSGPRCSLFQTPRKEASGFPFHPTDQSSVVDKKISAQHAPAHE